MENTSEDRDTLLQGKKTIKLKKLTKTKLISKFSLMLFDIHSFNFIYDYYFAAFNKNDQPCILLQMWWLIFWDTFSSRNNPNNFKPITY